MPDTRWTRRSVTALTALAIGCVVTAAGLIILLGQVSAPVGPVSGPDGFVSHVPCGNAFTAPPLTGIFTDIDADTGGPGFFQTMADTACSHAKAPRQAGGGVLTAVGVLAILGAGWSRRVRRPRGRHLIGFEPPAPEQTER